MGKFFTRYLYTGIMIVLLSFIILASMLFMLTARYAMDERAQIMRAFGQSLSGMTDLISGPNASRQTRAIYALNLSVIAKSLDARVAVTAPDGSVIICSDNVPISEDNYRIGESIMNSVNAAQQYTGIGNLGGLYSDSQFNIGIPIRGSYDKIIGAVFVSSSPTGYTEMLGDMTRIFFFSFLLVLFLSFLMIYFSTRVMVRPMRQMSDAAKRFAKGDFDARIEVDAGGEIAELAENLNNMADSLANLEELRAGFIANVSHDLRTPMTTISGFVDGILDGTIPPEMERHYLEIVSTETKRLSRLVRTLLDISRMESGEYKLHLCEFDISETLRRTVLSFEQRIEEKELDLTLDLPEGTMMISGDSDAISRVAYNLCDNAVKFSNRGGYLKISLRERGDFVEFTVRNSGNGIAAGDLQSVFERFYKADKSRGLDKSGLGLGLYIVKSLVDQHGGVVTVNSEEGSYCEFRVSLPKVCPAQKHENLPRA